MSAELSLAGNILMVGVGGQGIILASELVSLSLLAAGFDVKKSEVHGMSQRGGRVESHVRFGSKVHSPLIARGEVDILLGFELAETLRSLDWLASGGKILAATTSILPWASLMGTSPYPHDAADQIRSRGIDLTLVDAKELASRGGEAMAANVALVGRLSSLLPVPVPVWEKTIASLLPAKAVERNLAAFRLGLSATGR